ncbi:MAG: type I-B CRISPR-associated protein Cas7/Cst2/DevR [Acidobacteria bacterium]|nr:type I-B CRISPR-associated protein Cas7/Cst2/DevR [Acidobacteriota bacterium]
MSKLNLFATVLTYAAPSSNYRGESEENRTILQKITKNGKDHTIISPESMRNALREMLKNKIDDGQLNRKRRHDLDQLAVEFKEFPNAEKYADDFLFGYMVADTKAIGQNPNIPSKRDSVLRLNMAVSVLPYRFNAVFHQSPLNADPSPWKNSSTSALIHREVVHSAYQYPFALAGNDVASKPEWTKALLKSIAELTNVAGGHARSFYEMAPKSIVVRLTPSLVTGINTYGFNEKGEFPELSRINENDLPGNEFWVGGELARNMDADEKKRLMDEGVHFYDNPQKLLEEAGNEFLK